MDDPFRVRRFERVGELNADVQQRGDVERRPRGSDRASVSPSSSSMAMKCLPSMLIDRVDRADVGVIQGRGRARLALKALQRGGVVRHFRRQELEGHVPAEVRVLGFVDDTHAAAAEPGRDPVMGNRLTDHGFERRKYRPAIGDHGSVIADR